jgi:hypothetical protein
MTIYVYQCSSQKIRYGLTQDRTGGNLPLNACIRGNWVFNRTIEIELGGPALFSGLTAQEIISNIETKGYYIVDISIQSTERILN